MEAPPLPLRPHTMNPPTSADEPNPALLTLTEATTTHTQRAFTISSRKLPISKAGPIDAMSARLGIPVPEMIFGDNLVSIAHPSANWRLDFTAEAALDAVDKTGERMLQVAYAGSWSSSRERSSAYDIQQVVKPYDWSYSTTYKGTEHSTPGAQQLRVEEENGGGGGGRKQIPLELLKRRDPILFFDEVVLFESELDDNGVSIYSVKVRVMEQRMLLLARLYMRLDNVLVRVRDTRVYVEFGTGEVIREYTVKEDGFENVKRGLLMQGLGPEAVTSALRDANQVAQLLPVVDQQIDSVTLSPS